MTRPTDRVRNSRSLDAGWILLAGMLAVSAACGGGSQDGGAPPPPPSPTIGLSVSSLRFAALEAGAAPAPRTVDISNSGGATLTWTAVVTGGAWLSVGATAGTAPSSLGVSVNVAGLPAGTHAGTITIAAAGATNSPQTVTVSLTVVPDVSFAAVAAFPVGRGLHASAVADLDQDGRPDLVVTNQDDGTISILLGTATGALGPKEDIGVGVKPSAVAVGDLDGDAIPDLAVANSGGDSVSILLGTGTGAFGSPSTLALGIGFAPSSVVTRDFDGDGALDLAVAGFANGGPGGVSILLGTGAGTFGSPTTFPTGNGPTAVVAGDFDGDGHLDLAVANYDFNNLSGNNVAILIGDGAGTFAAPVPTASGWRPIALASADLNGDGRPDLVVGSESSPSVQVLLNDGAGTFAAPVPYLPSGTGARSVAVGDFDGDGKPDLAVTSNCTCDSTVTVLLGTGTGAFGPATAYDAGGSSVNVGDLDGDGHLDLVATDFGAYALLALGRGDGTFMAPRNFGAGTSDPRGLAVADFDASGTRDVAVVHWGGASGELSVWPGDGAAGMGSPTSSALGSGPTSVAVGDLNGDGRADAAVTDGSTVSILLGTASGFGSVTNFVVGGIANFVAVHDLDGDGKLDLAVADMVGGGSVSVLRGNGAGGFGAATDYAVGYEPRWLAIGDLNGDGRPDLVVANRSTGTISVLLGQGGATFGPDIGFSASVLRYVGLADFDGDGQLDLVNSDSAHVEIRPGRGDGTFASPVTYGLGGASGVVGDFNGDGRLDVALTQVGGTLVSFLLGAGDGSFVASQRSYAAALPVTFSSGSETGAIATGDFDGDGKADLVCSGGGYGVWPQYVSLLPRR